MLIFFFFGVNFPGVGVCITILGEYNVSRYQQKKINNWKNKMNYWIFMKNKTKAIEKNEKWILKQSFIGNILQNMKGDNSIEKQN